MITKSSGLKKLAKGVAKSNYGTIGRQAFKISQVCQRVLTIIGTFKKK